MANNQNQNQNKGNQNPVKVNPQNPTEADLAKALGTTVPEVKTTPAPAPVANKPAEAPKPETDTLLENLLKALPEKTQESIKRLPKDNQLDIAKDYFAMTHPDGLADEFTKKLAETLPGIINKLADEFMVKLTGREVKVMFPDGEGTPTVTIIDPNAPKTKAKGEKGERAQWGESSVTKKDGKVINFESPGAMGKSLGLLMKGWMYSTTVDCFTKPHNLDGSEKKVKFEILSAEKGKGIHIKEV